MCFQFHNLPTESPKWFQLLAAWVKTAGLCLEVRARMSYAKGRAEAISVLRYQLYELLMNMSQTENACRFMDEGNLYVQQEAGGCYMHDRNNEMWKFLSMYNQKIIKPLKFCIMRTWLIIFTTCFACYFRHLPTPILHLCCGFLTGFVK